MPTEFLREMTGPAGPLEARLDLPDGAPRAVAVCGHPHPLHGGTMHTKALYQTAKALTRVGVAAVRFNFRGVGASEGTHGEGRAELADVAGALAHVRASLDGAPRLVAVAGYSFGSHVGGRAAAADPGVGFYLGVAPVVARYDYGFLADIRGRVALVSGTRDEYSDPAKLAALVASLPSPPWVRALEADHFFGDKLDELGAACGEAIAWAEG